MNITHRKKVYVNSPRVGRLGQVLVDDDKAVGVKLRRGGKVVKAKRAVVMNADRWAAAKLLPEGAIPEQKR